MEVNSSPGLEGIENATGKDIAGQIIEFIECRNAQAGQDEDAREWGDNAKGGMLRDTMRDGRVMVRSRWNGGAAGGANRDGASCGCRGGDNPAGPGRGPDRRRARGDDEHRGRGHHRRELRPPRSLPTIGITLAPVIAVLRDAGIPPGQIQTSGLSVDPQFADTRNATVDRNHGFRASGAVTVESRDLASRRRSAQRAVRSPGPIRSAGPSSRSPKRMSNA